MPSSDDSLRRKDAPAISTGALRHTVSDEPSEVSVFLGVCAYLPVLCLIPVLTTPGEFVRFHAKQGLALFVAEFLSSLCLFIPRIGLYLTGGLLIFIAALICAGINEVLKRRRWELPLFRGLSDWIDL